MRNLILQSNVAGEMDFGYERPVNTWRWLFYRIPSSTSETIEVRKYVSSNGIFKIDLYRQDLQFSKLQTFMRGTTELDSSTFLNLRSQKNENKGSI